VLDHWRVRPRLARNEVVVLVLAGVLLALITADVMSGGLLAYLDENVRDATMPSDGAPTWTRVVGILGNVGVAGTTTLVVAIVTMQVTWRWWPGVLVAGQLAATGLVVVGLKYLVGRPAPGGGIDVPAEDYPGYFPSGHTATAAVCVGAVVYLLSTWRGGSLARARRRGLVAGAVAGVVVAVSTVLGGFHWFSDAAAGLVIGAAVLVAGFGMAEQRTSLLSESPRRLES
jgi:membrane-associated phospholipid phosphatase